MENPRGLCYADLPAGQHYSIHNCATERPYPVSRNESRHCDNFSHISRGHSPCHASNGSSERSARISACRAARVRKVEAIKVKKAMKRELIVATMTSRMIGTPVFSDRAEFSVTTSLMR